MKLRSQRGYASVVKCFLSILLTLVLTPALVVGSPGGYTCGDGVLRPHCCCPEETLENGESPTPPQSPQVQAQTCCEYTPGTLAVVEHVGVETSPTDFSIAKLFWIPSWNVELSFTQTGAWAFSKEHPPPAFLPLIQHVRLLI